MFVNKYLNFGYLSLAAIIFGIVISVSLVKAESPLDSYSNSLPYYIVPVSAQQEPAEENAEEEELEEYELYIKGMTCANCEVKVKEALLNCSGIKNAWVSHEEGSAVIEADSDLMDYDEIAGAVENAGFTVIDEEE